MLRMKTPPPGLADRASTNGGTMYTAHCIFIIDYLTPHISHLDSAHHWSNVVLIVSARYTLVTYVCYIQAKRLIAYAFLLLDVTVWVFFTQTVDVVLFGYSPPSSPLGRTDNHPVT